MSAEEVQVVNGSAAGAAGAAGAAQAVPQPGQAVSGHRTSRKRTGKAKTAGNGQAATAADSNQRTIAITLPKETLDWYAEQAAQAPFEPSVQRYIAWELRQWAVAGQQQQAEGKAAIAEAQQ